jgi:predicted amidohydrolase YtcJ
MQRPILIRDVRLPLSHQWKDTPVEILIEGEMIKSVQPRVELGEDLRKQVRTIEGRGRIALPGLFDAHAHLVQTALSSIGADLSPAKTIQDVLDLLREHAEKSSSKFVFGHTFDPSALKEHRYLTLEDLDSIEDAVRGRVVYVPRRDYHSCVVNRAGLQRIPFPQDVVGIQTLADGKSPSGFLNTRPRVVR